MTNEHNKLPERIIQDPDIMVGKPVIKGTRIPVELVLAKPAANPDLTELYQITHGSRLMMSKRVLPMPKSWLRSSRKQRSRPTRRYKVHWLSRILTSHGQDLGRFIVVTPRGIRIS